MFGELFRRDTLTDRLQSQMRDTVEAAVAVEDSMMNSMLDGLSTAYIATSTRRKKKKEDKKGKHVDWLDSQVNEVRELGTKELV